MQNSETCMFCRYRKARFAACCAAQDAAPTRQEDRTPQQREPASQQRDPVLAPSARQEAPQYA